MPFMIHAYNLTRQLSPKPQKKGIKSPWILARAYNRNAAVPPSLYTFQVHMGMKTWLEI